MSQPIRGQGGHLCFGSAPKCTYLLENIEILLPVKFHRIPFSGFKTEGENVSVTQRLGRSSCFPIGLKNTNLVEDIDILLSVKFRYIPFGGIREVENVSANQRPGRPTCFSDRPEKHKLGRGHWDLNSCQVFSGFWVEVENVYANQRPGRPSCFSDRPEKHNLVEDIEILHPVKFRWIPVSGFRRKVENDSANQRPGRPSCFFDRPEKHKCYRGRCDLAFCQVSLNSVQRFQRRSQKCEKLTTDGRTTDNAWSQ